MKIKFPMSSTEFSSKTQEKKPLLMKATADIQDFGWIDANHIIERSDISSPDFKIVDENIRSKEEYVESYLDVGTLRHRLIKPKVYNLMRDGATIVANKIFNEPKLDAFSKCIASFTQRRVVNSIYAAFGSKASSQAHWDTRDVFVIQLIGKKQWTIFEPSFNSPLHIHQSRDFKERYPCPANPYLNVLLEEGDVLYLPRGWWHHPKAIGCGTFHLAVGTFPAYTIDYLNWALNQMTENVYFRESLTHWENDQQRFSTLSDHISAFIGDGKNYVRFSEFCATRIRENSSFSMDIFGDPNSGEIEDNFKLRISPNYFSGNSDKYLFSNGVKLNASGDGHEILKYIKDSPSITVNSLLSHFSSLDTTKLKHLIYQLCEQDVLEVVRP